VTDCPLPHFLICASKGDVTNKGRTVLECIHPSMPHYFKGTEELGNQFLNLLYHWL